MSVRCLSPVEENITVTHIFAKTDLIHMIHWSRLIFLPGTSICHSDEKGSISIRGCLSAAYINLLLVARCYLHRIDAKNRSHIKSTSSYKSYYVNLPQATRCYLHRLDVKNGSLSKAVYWSNKAKV